MAGRPRKATAQRYPSGRTRPESWDPKEETEAQVKATVLAYRSRQLGERHASSAGQPEAGYELGRMWLTGMLTRRQHDAGIAVARLYDRYHKAMGYPSTHPKAMDWSMVSRGLPCISEDESDLKALANRYMLMLTAIADCGRHAVSAVRALCVEDTITRDWPNHTLRALRTGLNSAGDFFGIPHDEA